VGAEGTKGRTVTLHVKIDDGNVEDVLRLGEFEAANAHFTNQEVEAKLADLSERARDWTRTNTQARSLLIFARTSGWRGPFSAFTMRHSRSPVPWFRSTEPTVSPPRRCSSMAP
jgi:hypothetical protein